MDLLGPILASCGIVFFAFTALVGLGDAVTHRDFNRRYPTLSVAARVVSLALVIVCVGLIADFLFHYGLLPILVIAVFPPACLLGYLLQRSLASILTGKWQIGLKWLLAVLAGVVILAIGWKWVSMLDAPTADAGAALALVGFGLGIFAGFVIPDFPQKLIAPQD